MESTDPADNIRPLVSLRGDHGFSAKSGTSSARARSGSLTLRYALVPHSFLDLNERGPIQILVVVLVFFVNAKVPVVCDLDTILSLSTKAIPWISAARDTSTSFLSRTLVSHRNFPHRSISVSVLSFRIVGASKFLILLSELPFTNLLSSRYYKLALLLKPLSCFEPLLMSPSLDLVLVIRSTTSRTFTNIRNRSNGWLY